MEVLDQFGNIKEIAPSGYSGKSGASGYSGTSGFSSSSGLSGQSGYSGTSGAIGGTGPIGLSGTSGVSGFSGGVADGSLLTVTNSVQEGITTSFADLTFDTNANVSGGNISHSTSSNTNRIVINMPGNYVISYTFLMQNGKLATAKCLKNGATLLPGSTLDGTLGPATGTNLYTYQFTASFVAGDYFTLQVKAQAGDNAENISLSVDRCASGPSGFSGATGGVVLHFNWESGIGPPPDVGFIDFNTNSSFAAVTTIYISRFEDSNAGGADRFVFLNSVQAGSTIMMSQGTNSATYVITAISNPFPAYFTLSVSFVSSTGSMFTAPFAPPFPGLITTTFGQAGISGYSGTSGISGTSGTSGTSGKSGYSGVSGATGNGTLLVGYKAADESRTNNTLAQDTAMTVNLVSGHTYEITAYMQVNGNGSSAQGLQFGFNCTANASVSRGYWLVQGIGNPTGSPFSVSLVGAASSTSGATNYTLTFTGTFNCNLSGNFYIWWAQLVTNATATTVKAGSFLTATQLS